MNLPGEALPYLEKGLRMNKKLLGESHPETTSFYSDLIEAHRALGDEQKASEYEQQAEKMGIKKSSSSAAL
jgi:hypothetical protein